MACSLSKEFIPNELRTIEPVWEDISGQYKLIIDLSGTKYKFLCHTGDEGKDLDIENVGNGFIFEKKWDNIFLYGEEVDDFHKIDKQKIFAVAFSATQEIDRIQQQEKTKLATAEAKITTLEAENTTLKARLDAIEAKLILL